LRKKDTDVYNMQTLEQIPEAKGEGYLVDKILDRTGNKGTGKMTIKEGADRASPVGTMSAALDARFIAFDKANRAVVAPMLPGPEITLDLSDDQRAALVEDVQAALYCSKICSYAQGLNLIRTASNEFNWGVDLGECARIWTGGCIIRSVFLGDIKKAYDRDPNLPNLLVDSAFRQQVIDRQAAWRRVAGLCVTHGLPTPSLYSSLAYYDQYRHADLDSASLVQAQRDFFGSHTFERKDTPGGQFFHCKWTDAHAIA
jgi:6-phosphogluconate dehydrogenase